MLRPSRAENRFYLILTVLIVFATGMAISHIEGRISGAAHQKAAHEQLLEHEEERGDYYKAKYEALAHEADWLTVTEAEAKFQQQARAGQ